MKKAEVQDLQRDLNAFSKKHLRYVTPLMVDGKKGRSTNKQIKLTKWYLGYVRSRVHTKVGHEFRVRLRHPEQRNRYADNASLRRGRKRRGYQRVHARRNQFKSFVTSGVTRYDGVPVAAVAVPILNWCRAHGWHGRLVSGWRDPIYSRSLCRRMCGRDSCSGTCAGTSSNHVGQTRDRFALDVSSYSEFRQVVARCPVSPHIHNSLPRDLVHFSPSGN